MSPYEPKSAERNEAFPDHRDSADFSQNSKVRENATILLRLPDLAQIDTEPEDVNAAVGTIDPVERDEYASPEQEGWDTKPTPRSRSSRFSTSKLGFNKSRKQKIFTIAGMLFFAGFAGFGAAHLTDWLGFYGGNHSDQNYNCPAPDAPAAPRWEKPQYAADKSASKGSPSFDLPVDVTTPSFEKPVDNSRTADNRASFSGSSERFAKPFAPPTLSETAPSPIASPPSQAFSAAMPVGPNMSRPPVLASDTSTYRPNTAITEADRFSPERVQAVLQNQQQGSVQTVQYPSAAPTSPDYSAASYPQTSVPVVAQRPNLPQYPTTASYPVQNSPYPVQTSPYMGQASPYAAQASPTTMPPVSPYPPVGSSYPATQNQSSQNWPSQQTQVTPSTPQTSGTPVYPSYPSTGYPTSNTATNTQPIYQR